MAINKHFITLLLFIFLAAPITHSMAQSLNNETSQTEDTGSKEKKAEKKKKYVIEIDSSFFVCMGVDATTMILIISMIYYRNYKKMDYIFTFAIFNIVIFLLTYVLNEVKISLGAAFGLFAVFSMLRYRTAGISMIDMTYLFIFIAIGLISAIHLEYYDLAILNGVIIAATFLLDSNILFRREHSKCIRYENIELIIPEKRNELMADLSKRTGLKIHRVTISRINFLRDSATIKVYYYD